MKRSMKKKSWRVDSRNEPKSDSNLVQTLYRGRYIMQFVLYEREGPTWESSCHPAESDASPYSCTL